MQDIGDGWWEGRVINTDKVGLFPESYAEVRTRGSIADVRTNAFLSLILGALERKAWLGTFLLGIGVCSCLLLF